MYSQQDALVILASAKPVTEQESKALEFIRSFVTDHSQYWSRQTEAGHLTASAWITNRARTKAVLLHHKKLDIWVQPGGHIDHSDASLLAAAQREAQEETGLQSLVAKSEQVFDVDVHKIPARKNEPEHWHLDVRFWFIADNESLQLSQESNDLQWLTGEQIRQKTDEESVLRMVRKSLVD